MGRRDEGEVAEEGRLRKGRGKEKFWGMEVEGGGVEDGGRGNIPD